MVTVDEAKRRIDEMLASYRTATTASPVSVLPDDLSKGKIYEAWVLSLVLERLARDEAYTISLQNSRYVRLKASPGPINRNYPYFTLHKAGARPAEIWTDVQFLTLSHFRRGAYMTPTAGDHHELDILMVPAGVIGRPSHEDVILGVECKATSFEKHMLRAIIGVRRELSYLHEPKETEFDTWPRSEVPADPSSCLMIFSTDEKILNMASPGDAFGIDFRYEPLP